MTSLKTLINLMKEIERDPQIMNMKLFCMKILSHVIYPPPIGPPVQKVELELS